MFVGLIEYPRPATWETSRRKNEHIRFIMLGGFLGAANHYDGAPRTPFHEPGKRSASSHDQAQDLVDTHSLREQGFPVEEVAGACF